jgi:hypothetical protein
LFNVLFEIVIFLAIDTVGYYNAAIPLSEDHKPNRSDERQRIEQAGGNVRWAGNVAIFLIKS